MQSPRDKRTSKQGVAPTRDSPDLRNQSGRTRKRACAPSARRRTASSTVARPTEDASERPLVPVPVVGTDTASFIAAVVSEVRTAGNVLSRLGARGQQAAFNALGLLHLIC